MLSTLRELQGTNWHNANLQKTADVPRLRSGELEDRFRFRCFRVVGNLTS